VLFLCYDLADMRPTVVRDYMFLSAKHTHAHTYAQLYLCNNKISQIENLGAQTDLDMLELGSNRIRVGGGGGGLCMCFWKWLCSALYRIRSWARVVYGS
jgi:hypothetical protein